MNMQYLKLLRIMLTPTIYRVPLRVMRELRKQGVERLPGGSNAGKARVNALKFARKWLAGERLTRHNGRWVLNSFFPPFPSKAFDRMFENMLSGRKFSPVSAYIAVTGECPFNCTYCSAKARTTVNYTTEQLTSLIDQLAEAGVSIIGFTGGEPMLRNDLEVLVVHAAGKGIETIVFTSGYELDEERAAALKAAGLWSVCVSLDSARASEFNDVRNSVEAYETAVTGLVNAVNSGLYTMAGAVATPEFVHKKRVNALYKMMSDMKIDELRLVEPMPCGKLRKDLEKMLLSKDDINLIRDFHVKTNRASGYTKVCAFNHVESPDMLGCGGGTQHLYIDAGGEVCPCDFTPLSFGNVTKEPFGNIWARMNEAMVMPRRHCFIQTNYQAINQAVADSGEYPLSPEKSCELCRKIGFDDFPDYFKAVMNR